MKKTIAFITDLHIDEAFPKSHGVDARQNFERILEDIKSRDVDHLIIGGDIGENDVLGWVFDKLNGFKTDLVLGNHDEFKAVSKHFKRNLNPGSKESYYHFDDENFRYIFLDSSSFLVSEIQLAWLENTFQTSKDVLLFVHHPLLAVDVVVDRKYPLYNREDVLKILEESACRVTIFCGHYHTADECSKGNIIQILTPAVSFQVLKNTDETVVTADKFYYRLIHLNGASVETELVEFSPHP